MPSSDDSPPRPRARYELKKRYFHRGYLWPWTLVILVPFVLRLVMFHDITFPLTTSPITTEVSRPEEVHLYKYPKDSSEGSSDIRPNVEIPIIQDSTVVRPDDAARITHDNGTNHDKDPMEDEPSRKRTQNERSTKRQLPVTKRPRDEDDDAGNLGNSEDNVVGVVDEVQLRQIGERIDLIRRWESGGERIGLHGRYEGLPEEQEMANDQLLDEGSEDNEESKDIEEGEAEEEKLASRERTTADEGDKRAAEEGRVAGQLGADEERRIAEELEEETVMKALVEREATEGMEVNEEKRGAEKWDIDEDRKLAAKKEAEEERRSAEERDAEEELMSAKEREAEEGTQPAEERAAGEEWKAAQEKEARKERTVDERREAGEQDAEVEKSTEKKRESEISESYKDQGNQDFQDLDVKETNSSAQRTSNDRKGDERTVESEEPTEESKHTQDQNQETEQRDKEDEKREDSEPRYRADLTTPSDQTRGASLAEGECDLFDGDWQYDSDGPLYTNSTCFYIRGDHNCMSNGRPDTDYLNWRWKPRGCDLPRFDARAFMQEFKGKTIGFVGDSLARNQMQSMLCMLSLVEVPINLQEDDFITRWLYEQNQVTLAVVWSPYLLKESQNGILGFEKGQSVLYLDVLDPVWTSVLPDYDIVVLSVGQWYFKPSVYIKQDKVIGCHYCPNLNLTEVGFSQAYAEGLRLALEKVAADWKGTAILSTFPSGHGERGPGEEGEQCRRERPLEKEEWERSFRGMNKEMRDVVWGEFNRLVSDKSKLKNHLHIEFLDVNTLSLLRPDGHPGPFYNAHPYEGKTPDEWVHNDCLHWCLPGPVDTWNHLLVKIVQTYL